MAFRQSEEAKPATINREIELLRTAFRLAADSKKLPEAPPLPKRLQENNSRRGCFEKGDFLVVLAKVKDRDVRDFLEWFYRVGMRPKEIRSLTWSDLDRETMTLRLHASNAKNRHGRAIALEGPIREIVERRIQERRLGVDYIFHRCGKAMGEFRKLWKTACTAAGVAGRLPDDLRRTAVRNLVRAGVPQNVAMKISGHRTASVFSRYDIASHADVRQAVVGTAAYVDALPVEKPAKKGRSLRGAINTDKTRTMHLPRPVPGTDHGPGRVSKFFRSFGEVGGGGGI